LEPSGHGLADAGVHSDAGKLVEQGPIPSPSLLAHPAVEAHEVVSVESAANHLAILPDKNSSEFKSSLMEINAPDTDPDEGFSGCTQGANAQTGCESICYRIMCTTEPFGECSAFTADIEKASGGSWYPPENKDDQGFELAYHKSTKVKLGWRSSNEKTMDFWHQMMKLNVPDGHQEYYFTQLNKLGHPEQGGSAMTQALKRTYSEGIDAVLRAIELKRVLDTAISKYVSSSDCKEALEDLRKEIEEVDSKYHYPAMESDGLRFCRSYAKKMDAFQNMRIANGKGTQFRRTTDEKADAVYKEIVTALDVARQHARERKDFKTEKQWDARQSYFNNAAKLQGDMHQNLATFFKLETKKAIDEAKKNLPKAIKGLQPLVKRLKSMDNMFEAERNAADAALSELFDDAKQRFDELVNKGRGMLTNREKPREKPGEFKDITANLAKELNVCKELLPQTKEQCQAMDTLSEHIKAWSKLQPAIFDAEPLAEQHEKYKAAVAEATEKQKAATPEPMAAKEGVPPSTPKKPPPLDLGGVKDVSKYDKDKAVGNLRQGIDAAVCAKMDEDFLTATGGEVETAKKLGHNLDGLPPATPCTSREANFDVSSSEGGASDKKKSGGNWFSNLWASIFGSALHSTTPAMLTCVLLGLPLWSSDA